MELRSKRFLTLVTVVLCTLTLSLFITDPAFAETELTNSENAGSSNLARPSTSGALHVDGTNLVDQDGNIVQLQGVSTHGIAWYSEFVNQDLFNQVSTEWDGNLIRLAAYSTEFVNGNKKLSMDTVEKGIDYAINADMYVIIDWHILEDGDPNTNIDAAMSFFHSISQTYGDCPNIIYEICNEPNGDTSWSDIKEYANCIIPIIKSEAPNAVIVVGTPDYDRDLTSAIDDPIVGYSNIMYTFHFYAASHKSDMMEKLDSAVSAGLPVFVTECGMSEDDGDGKIDYQQAALWFDYLKEKNIPFAIWSLSNKDENSAMIKSGVHHRGALSDGELTTYGKAVKTLLQGGDITAVPMQKTGWNLDDFLDSCRHHFSLVWGSLMLFMVVAVSLTILIRSWQKGRRSKCSYNDYLEPQKQQNSKRKLNHKVGKVALFLSTVCSLVYLIWRMAFSIPFNYGWLAVFFNLVLLIVELIGFVESTIHYDSMIKLRDYPLPNVKDKDFPDVDIFIATYNEPEELLRKTLIGCKNMNYPDKSKVHIYVCDDKRRASMRALAEEVGVSYFDRPDNKGAKAGNLNHAMALTSSPYIVTFDADMIPMENFLLKTIPYYIDAEQRNIPLGFIQTPQCFYTEDIFQHNLYAENNVPNEQDFFYRTIEPAKTSTNSVIYGGSNTILSRKALEDIGGFYTESITEDFATGLMIEAKGYLGLGLPEPLASGLAPSSFQEHIQQRTRWGRGVILTAKKLKFMGNKNLNLGQKLSYLSSVVYWFSPLFNAVYLLMPLLFAVFGIPVFRCTVPELLLFWLPMFLAQNACLYFISNGSISAKWSGIQETCMVPFLLVPITKEALGFSLSVFKVTDKRQKSTASTRSIKTMAPFIALSVIYAIGIIHVVHLSITIYNLGLLILLFWLVRNYFFILMSLFLADGRDYDGENVKVKKAEPVSITTAQGTQFGASTIQLTEHNLKLSLKGDNTLRLGESLNAVVTLESKSFKLKGTIVEVKKGNKAEQSSIYTMEIMDFFGQQDDYVYALYNRVPTLPQTLTHDLGIVGILARNFAHHL